MGLALPQVVTEDRASGAQVIDGSLKFNGGYLTRTPSSNGNRRTWTYSGWIKFDKNAAQSEPLLVAGNSSSDFTQIFTYKSQNSDIAISAKTGSSDKVEIASNNLLRDTGWYHIVAVFDSTGSGYQTDSTIYINGVEISRNTNTFAGGQNYESWVNSTAEPHYLGYLWNGNTFKGEMSQVYLIDGQALGPENFGYTDGLTNTWRPKKYTGDFNVGFSDYSGIFAPYSAAARFNSFKTYTTLNENSTGHTLPMSNPSHYGGKTLDLASGGFQIQTNNSAAGDFFMAVWVNLDSYETSKQFGVDIAGNYVYFETLSSGAVKIRHYGSGGQSSNSGYANDTNQWQHWALSRSGGSLRAFVDGEQIVTDTGGISGDNTVLANSKFNFFGADNNTTSYNINGQVIDAVIYIGQGVSGNFTPPTAPLIDASGNINHYSGFSDSQLYFASPLVDVSGSDPNGISDYYTTGTNSFYLPFDGNSPIGQDQSGSGNNWTPVNFGGSVALDNPNVSGARPILNTDGGGNVARPGVFGSEVGAYYAVTVASVGGSNKYHFDGVDRPNPTLIRGATYTFDQSDSTNGGGGTHPLRFATAADAAGSTQYTDGVVTNGTPGQAGAYTKITVPHNAPATLYYYCTNHGGMGSSTSQITDESKADPYAWKNVLALPLVGSANDVSNQINSGSTAKVLAKQGNVTASSAKSNFYNGSFYFDGSGDYLGATSNADFAMGTGDFTLECWVYRNSSSAFNNFIATRGAPGTSAGFTFGAQSNGNGNDIEFYTDGLKLDGGNQTITNGKWHHVTITRTGTTLSSYVNGILNTTASNSQNFSNTSLAIGMTNDGSQGPMLGYIQDVRIYKGVAKYSGGSVGDQVFIPASTNPDILPDTPSGVSGSSKLAKVTDGAVSLDGSGDYLTGPSTDTFVSDAQYTIDGFIYLNSAPGNNAGEVIFDTGSGGNDPELNVFNNSGNIQLYDSLSNNTNWNGGASYMGVKRWHYFKQTVNGSSATDASATHKLYIDGKLGVSNTINLSSRSASSVFAIGARTNGSVEIDAIISNFRYRSVLDDSLTVPTEPLTNVTNTKLLCCQSNTQAGAATVSPNLAETINDGTVWSDFLSTAAAFGGTHVRVRAFDGNTSTMAGTAANTGYAVTGNDTNALEFIPPSPIAFSSSVKVRGRNTGQSTMGVKIDTGSGYGSEISLSSDNLQTVVSGSGNLVKIKVYTKTYSGENELGGIAIDDVYLTDPITVYGDVSATNFNPFNTDINTVRGQETGYCTLNPLDGSITGKTFSNGNLKVSMTSSTVDNVYGTLNVSSGRWYWEVKSGGIQGEQIGTADADSNPRGTSFNANGYSYEAYQGRKVNNNSYSSYGASYANGDIIGIALDMDVGQVTFYKNGISQGVAFTGLIGKSMQPMLERGSGYTMVYVSNFGQKPFKFPPPAGFQPLNAANVRPETVITRPDHYVGAITYSGVTNSGDKNITSESVQFTPDLVWVKVRTGGNESPFLYDTVRGDGSGNKRLKSDSNLAQTTYVGSNDLEGFVKGGFTMNGNNGHIYYNGYTHVAWCWRAGGRKNTFTVDNIGYASAAAAGFATGGSNITPTAASVGTKQGFSIVTWDVGSLNGTLSLDTGLTQAPEFVITKVLDHNDDWLTFHKELSSTESLVINGTRDKLSNAAYAHTFNSNGTISGLVVPNWWIANKSYVFYSWHSVPGLQKFGKYEGNTTEGAFVELGFRPAILWIKAIDQTWYWNVHDNQRGPINPIQGNFLRLDSNAQENAGSGNNNIDFLSNGFKIRSTTAQSEPTNVNGQTYVYCAWAEAPEFNLYGGQSNAR